MLNLTINGKDVRAQEGSTILEAARENGIEIPTLCYHPLLNPMGHCRMCLVEVEGIDRPITACDNPAQDGMVVFTDTPRLKEMRKVILEMMIAAHPTNGCYTCDRSGNCEFQDLVNKLELTECNFKTDLYHYPTVKDNPYIVRDYEKCILCGRCVQACREVQGKAVLDLVHKGFGTKVAPVLAGQETTMEAAGCVYCGQCVQVCPVGALVEKNRRYQIREFEMTKVKSVCTYCGVGCGLDLYVNENEVVKIMGNENSEVNKGSLCVKGRFEFNYLKDEGRLTKPLIRDGEKGMGRFREATWEEAMELVAKEIGRISRESAPEGIGLVSSARCTNEENYLLQKLGRAVLGTNNIDHSTQNEYSYEPVNGLISAFGCGATTNAISEMAASDCILVFGSNPTEENPVIGQKLKAAVIGSGKKLIIVDSRPMELTKFSRVQLRPKPGTELALINGMLSIIINENLFNQKYIEERTEGFEDLKQAITKYTPEKVSEVTGVSVDDLRYAARLYAQAPVSSIYFSMGIMQNANGRQTMMGLANLAMACGNVGKVGGGVNALLEKNNEQGAWDMGALPNLLTGYQKIEDEGARSKFEKEWGKKLPRNPGKTFSEMLKAIHNGELRGLYLVGEDPVENYSDKTFVEQAFRKLEFLVVQDMFLNKTGYFADVILPSAGFAEKEGTYTNSERRIQKLNKAIEPLGESRADWEIICDLARRLGYSMEYGSPAAIMEEIATLTPDYAGVSFERLGDAGLQWPCWHAEHPGTSTLYQQVFLRGRGKFNVVHFVTNDVKVAQSKRTG